jgi:hypothetical protein
MKLTVWIVVAGMVAVCLWVLSFRQTPWRVPIASHWQLTQGTEPNGTKPFVVPEGDLLRLLLAYPTGFPEQHHYGATILIYQGATRVVHLDFTQDTSSPCNWLAQYGMQAYILTPNAGGDSTLDRLLTRGQSYQLVHTNLQVGATIWMTSMSPSGKVWSRSRAPRAD